jgi:ribulose 1,5-bisphosphate carboxylase large subunit-like protein
MVTLAGGIYAGQLHALYELVGPSCAFFLGGAVALHKDGRKRPRITGKTVKVPRWR